MPALTAAASSLLVIDMQERLMRAIDDAEARTAAAARLIAAARMLEIPRVVSEQKPEKLGPTVAELQIAPGEALAKMSFDCCGSPSLARSLDGESDLVICGVESHVCVLQTVLSLRATGRAVAVVADATGSRKESDRQAAFARMRDHGAEIVTSEMVLFEWMGTAEHPRFRDISALVR
ncbi:isochorismatase family protein [Litorisediminicola beolgyonensis]|uniref:Isochorismatase family protein n=1 Tax=Litorisediminicola beolgyonensis TaxID=1173614 RepID=A0ABW3ZH82_9RHOB